MVSCTSARPNGGRPEVPAKMTSSILPPRSDLAPCSPITQARASTTLDLPEPLGPTMQVMPGSSCSVVDEAKDLKPLSVRLLRYNVWLLAAAVGQRPVSASICHAERRILAAAPWGRSAPPRLPVASAQQSLPQLTCLVRVGQQIGPRPHVRSQYGDRGRQVADQLPVQRDSDASPLVIPEDLEGQIGRASCTERRCTEVIVSVGGGAGTKKNNQ